MGLYRLIAVDTSALVAILNEEASASSLIKHAAGSEGLIISAGTAVELGVVVVSKWGEAGLVKSALLMGRLRVETADVTTEHVLLAVEAYRKYGKGSGSPARLNLGDCFSYALAKSLDIPLLFTGDDFVHTDIRSATASR